MNTSQEHEAALAGFVTKAKRARVAALLGSRDHRCKLIQELPHFSHWDNRVVVALPASLQTAAGVLGELQRLGAPANAYVLSAIAHLDARSCSLAEAVRDIVGSSTGTVISCVPGRLAYFEGEERGERFILRNAT